MSGRLQLVIPMAGSGERFRAAGFAQPKPFIDVAGQPMIARVLENLPVAADVTLIARAQDLKAEPALAAQLKKTYGAHFVIAATPTGGAAATVLLARGKLDAERPLLIANADQLIDGDIADFTAAIGARDLDGLIMTFREPSRDPKWSYAATDAHGLVTRTREKEAISEDATVGIYLFRRAGDFVAAAEAMIARGERSHGEFYVCPVYNELIARGKRIGIFPIPRTSMHGLGTPEDLARYLASVSAR